MCSCVVFHFQLGLEPRQSITPSLHTRQMERVVFSLIFSRLVNHLRLYKLLGPEHLPSHTKPDLQVSYLVFWPLLSGASLFKMLLPHVNSICSLKNYCILNNVLVNFYQFVRSFNFFPSSPALMRIVTCN